MKNTFLVMHTLQEIRKGYVLYESDNYLNKGTVSNVLFIRLKLPTQSLDLMAASDVLLAKSRVAFSVSS